MPTPLNAGKTQSGERLYFLSLARLNEWPSELRVYSKYLRLFIACDAGRLRASEVRDFTALAIRQGLVDLSVWGPSCCKNFHVPFVDAAPLSRNDDSDLIIANCNQCSLPMAVKFFIKFGHVARKYRRHCKSLLFVSIHNSVWAKSIRRSLRELRS